MKDNKILLIVIAALLTLSIVATGVLIFRNNPTPSGSISTTVNTLSVSGEGSVTVIPDVGYISLGVESKDVDVKTAENDNSGKMDAIIKELAALDIAETDIKTTSFYIYPQYQDYGDEKPQYYVVSSTIQVTVNFCRSAICAVIASASYR